MDYLKNYGFTKEDIKDIYNNLDEEDVHELIIHEDRIINILKIAPITVEIKIKPVFLNAPKILLKKELIIDIEQPASASGINFIDSL